MRTLPALIAFLSTAGSFSIAACSMERPEFGNSGNSGGGAGQPDGDGGMGGTTGDGDGDVTRGDDEVDGSGGTTGDGDGDGSGGTTGDGDGSGGTTGDGDGSGGTGEVEDSCETGEIDCDGSCVDPSSDDDYCGASGDCTGVNAGEACATGYACDDGTCKLQCPGTQLACGDSCINPESDDEYCGASGACTGDEAGQVCGGANKCVSGICQAPDGASCSGDSDCISGKCSTFYQDQDGDGFGASSGATKVCGTAVPSGLVVDNRDCCDVATDMAEAALVNPSYSGGPTTDGAEGCAQPFDYNCDATFTSDRPAGTSCSSFGTDADCPEFVFSSSNPVCGAYEMMNICSWSNDLCQTIWGGQTTYTCY